MELNNDTGRYELKAAGTRSDAGGSSATDAVDAAAKSRALQNPGSTLSTDEVALTQLDTYAAATKLAALAHAGRLDVFRLLVRAGPRGLAVNSIATQAGAQITTVSAQLSVLSQAGLLTSRREGRSVIYASNYDDARGLIAFLMEDCCLGREEIIAPLNEITARACC